MAEQMVVNKWSEPVQNFVDPGAVRQFAEAIGDVNPLYLDEQAARAGRHGRLIAPPTFSMTFDYGNIVGADIKQAGLIHGEQTFSYKRPLFVGETVWCACRLTDVNTRGGSTGKLTFYVYERRCADEQDQTILVERMTVIVKGGELA